MSAEAMQVRWRRSVMERLDLRKLLQYKVDLIPAMRSLREIQQALRSNRNNIPYLDGYDRSWWIWSY